MKIICRFFAVAFAVTAIFSLTAKDKLYGLIFDESVYTFSEYSPRETVLKKNDYLVYGTYDGEGILWKCVSQDGVTLQSEYILDFCAYGSSSDWNSSDLKKKLQTNIAETESLPYIPTKKELAEIPQSERKKQPTASAASNCRTRFIFVRKNCWYWTGSKISTNSLSVCAVTQSGSFYKSPATDELMGVCPMLKLKSSEVVVCSGDGTREYPYFVQKEVSGNG